MSDSSAPIELTIPFSAEEMAAIDAWIMRHDDPKPDREDAIRQLIAGRLGVVPDHPSSIIPNIVTGRDIV